MVDQFEDIERKISRFEESLELDERLKKIERRLGNTGGKGWIVIIAILISVAVPLMQLLQSELRTQRELKLAELGYEHTHTKDWLELVASEDISAERQARVLRFLANVVNNDRIKKWASDELAEVEGLLKKVRSERDVAVASALAANEEVIRLTQRIALANASSESEKESHLQEIQELEKGLLNANQELELSKQMIKTLNQQLENDSTISLESKYLVIPATGDHRNYRKDINQSISVLQGDSIVLDGPNSKRKNGPPTK